MGKPASDPPRGEFRRGRARLWVEFVLIFAVAPVVMAVALPPGWLFPALFGVTALGLVLLRRTPGFHWPDLLAGRRLLAQRGIWGVVLVFAALTSAASLAVLLVMRPEALFFLPRHRPGLLLMILVLYPLLSALPQEILFRVLFFRRFGALLPGVRGAIVLNGVLFSLAHLMYWSWIVSAMTFVGGLVFAWAYEVRQSFLLAVALHAVAGWILFSLGMGVYFYAGNAVRPF